MEEGDARTPATGRAVRHTHNPNSRWLLGAVFATSALFGGCGKDEKSDDKSKDGDTPTTVAGTGGGSGSDTAGTPVNSAAEIVGAWTLESVASTEHKDDAIVNTGISVISFRANGTVVVEATAFTLSVGDYEESSNCTSYSSAKFQVVGGTAISTEKVFAASSGSCGDSEAPSVTTLPDLSSSVRLNGGKLILSHDYTYADASGNSKKDTLVTTYVKKSNETWDGTGLDPRFQGSWKMSKVQTEFTCESSTLEGGDYAIVGSMKTKIDGLTFQEDQSEFSVGTGDKCTGSSTGTIEPGALTNEWKQETATADCITEEDDPPGYVEFFNRDFVTESGKWIQVISSNVADEDCAYENEFRRRLIAVREKQ